MAAGPWWNLWAETWDKLLLLLPLPEKRLGPGLRSGGRACRGALHQKRNVLGAVNALAAAEMALAGLETIISVDEVIKTMGQVGRAMPESLRETSQGGLATIPQIDKLEPPILRKELAVCSSNYKKWAIKDRQQGRSRENEKDRFGPGRRFSQGPGSYWSASSLRRGRKSLSILLWERASAP